MFITVDGLNKTGIPSALWDIMEPYSRVDRASGIAILAIVILVLSNLASNVPTGKWTWIYFTAKYLFFVWERDLPMSCRFVSIDS